MTVSSEAANPAAAAAPVNARRYIAAATIGNALEFYDFVTYTFFAIQIGHAFFPSHDRYVSLMLSLATFGAGFITRPIGGIVIGIYADRAGRRAAMMLSFTLMGAAIVALALVPSYAQIGIAAPILAVVARMVQGFSLGGEVGPATSYLLESSPVHRRGVVVAWQGASQGVAATAGALVGLLLSTSLPTDALETYGWRIAFLLGAVTLPFGLYIRRSLPETLHAPEHHVSDEIKNTGAWQLLWRHRRVVILGAMVLAGGTISTYVANYMTTYAQNTLHMNPTVAFAAPLVGNVIGIVFTLLGGALSDRFGRRPMMVWPTLFYLFAIYPMFLWVVQSRSGAVFILTNAVLALLSSLRTGAFYPALTESLPKKIRAGTLGIVYASMIALFGGTTQPVVTWLIHLTGNPMAPAIYLLAAVGVSSVAMYLMRESAPVHAARKA